MFDIKKNKGLYLELCLLLDYIEEYEELEWLGHFKSTWENRPLTNEELKDVVGLIEDYLPVEIECNKQGCYLVNDLIDAYTSIDSFEEYLEVLPVIEKVF